jgi:hypothetical protein
LACERKGPHSDCNWAEEAQGRLRLRERESEREREKERKRERERERERERVRERKRGGAKETSIKRDGGMLCTQFIMDCSGVDRMRSVSPHDTSHYSNAFCEVFGAATRTIWRTIPFTNLRAIC